MSEAFRDIASIDYPIIDSDAHVNEPPDLWLERLPDKWKERAPQTVETEHGIVWSFDGGKEKWPFGLTATAGLSYFQYRPMGPTYESIRPGSFDTKARLADLDADGIYAQVLYPSVTLKGAKVYSDERDLQLACVRAPVCAPTTSGFSSSAPARAAASSPRPSCPPRVSTTPSQSWSGR